MNWKCIQKSMKTMILATGAVIFLAVLLEYVHDVMDLVRTEWGPVVHILASMILVFSVAAVIRVVGPCLLKRLGVCG